MGILSKNNCYTVFVLKFAHYCILYIIALAINVIVWVRENRKNNLSDGALNTDVFLN